jgi:hypothetical protein
MQKCFRKALRAGVASSILLTASGVLSASVAQAKSPLEAFSFNAGGSRVACLKAGSGPALIIVHGLGGHKEDFETVIKNLAERRAVYACDMLGFGQSARDAPSVGIGAQAEVLGALLDSEKLKARSDRRRGAESDAQRAAPCEFRARFRG